MFYHQYAECLRYPSISVYFLVALSRLIHPSNIVFVLSFRVVDEVVMAIGDVVVCFRIKAIAKFS